MWTFNKKYSDKWKNKGLAKASTYLGKLFELLNENNINSYLILYPNPGQILLNDENVHEIYWKKWSSDNNVNLINLYKYFNKISKKEIIKKYFIPGDVHWNKKGHYLFFVINSSASCMLELSNQIKLTEEIIRHVIMRIKEKQYFKEPTEMITDENKD